ncbi:50S ribosomal protein L7/L12 [Candidatus Uhrbacteria bacterium]|jgi:large subunit ribosomal protein L7/L12|nr:50S ribosomal protein L7/L12 [Candidatus Uhrbacteria bacterium]
MSEEATAVEATEEKAPVEVPAQFKELVENIEKMSVIDLAELVKVLEDKFGVSAAAPAMMMAAPGAGGGDAAEEEQSSFDVEITETGDSKISVIKAVREITGQGLKEAKAIVDAVPAVVKEGASKEEAEELKGKLEEAGAVITLK